MGRSKAPSLPIKALSFCRPTELRAERWYAVPKGDETSGLGGFLGLTGPMGRRVLKFDGAFGPKGCGGVLRAHHKIAPSAPPSPRSGLYPPSEPARSVGRTHRSARSAGTIEPGCRRRLNPPAAGNTVSRRI